MARPSGAIRLGCSRGEAMRKRIRDSWAISQVQGQSETLQRYSRPRSGCTGSSRRFGRQHRAGLYAQAAPDDWIRPLIDTHKSSELRFSPRGVAAVLRLSHAPPPLPKTYPVWSVGAHARTGRSMRWCSRCRSPAGRTIPLEGWEAHPMRCSAVPVAAHRRHRRPAADLKEQWHDTLFAATRRLPGALRAARRAYPGALKHQWIDGTRSCSAWRRRLNRKPLARTGEQ